MSPLRRPISSLLSRPSSPVRCPVSSVLSHLLPLLWSCSFSVCPVCPTYPVQSFLSLSCLSHLSCSVLFVPPILFCLTYSVPPLKSWPFLVCPVCPTCPVLPVLVCPVCPTYLVLSFLSLSRLSHLSCSVLHVLLHLLSPVLVCLSRLSALPFLVVPRRKQQKNSGVCRADSSGNAVFIHDESTVIFIHGECTVYLYSR